MKKVISTLALFAFMFALSTNLQAQEPVQKKKKAKTEKSCCSEKNTDSTEKKSETAEKKCNSTEGKSEKKGGCCSAKKETEAKS